MNAEPDPHRVSRRAALAVVAFVVTAWLLGLGTLLPSSNRWFLVLLAPALVYRRARAYIAWFAPFALAVLAYEFARTLAHRINPDPFYQPQIDVDKVLGLGFIDVKEPNVEKPEEVANRIRKVLDSGIVPPKRLLVMPDCGLGYMPRTVAAAKLRAMGEGVRTVREEL